MTLPVQTRMIAGAVLAASLVALAGCAGNGEGGKKSSDTAAAKAVTTKGAELRSWQIDGPAWGKVGYRLDWQGFPFAGVKTDGAIREVRPYGDTIVAQEKGSTVTVMEAATGANRWSGDIANPLTKFVSVMRDPTDPSRLIATSESDVYVMAMQTGNLLARQKLARVVSNSPVSVGDTLVCGTAQGQVLSHNLVSGLPGWRFQSVGSIESNAVMVGGVVSMVSQAGDVVMLDATSGSLIGRARTFSGLANNPVTDGTNVYIASLDQSVWAFDVGGRTAWRYRTGAPIRSQPTVVGNMLVVETESGLTALSAADGSVLWKNKDLGGEVVATRKGDLVVFGGGAVKLVSAKKGDLIASAPAAGVKSVVTDTFADGALYLVTDVNTIVKLLGN